MRCEEICSRTALNRVRAPALPFQWSLNPYRSCAHACVYCYSRSYHQWLEMDPGEEFNTHILAKVNLPERLARELASRAWARELVAIGTAVDPYQPVEARHRITRRCLEVLLAARTPVSITTKNTLVLRDLDLLKEFARGPGCAVSFSVTTLDAGLARRLEPRTSPPLRRLEIMERLVAAGVPAGVMLAPVLPGITDRPGSLEAVIREAARHHAAFLHAGVLRLDGAAKTVFLDFVGREFPQLLPLYWRLYGSRVVPPPRYRHTLASRVERAKRACGIGTSALAALALQGHYGHKGGESPAREQLRLFPFPPAAGPPPPGAGPSARALAGPVSRRGGAGPV